MEPVCNMEHAISQLLHPVHLDGCKMISFLFTVAITPLLLLFHRSTNTFFEQFPNYVP